MMNLVSMLFIALLHTRMPLHKRSKYKYLIKYKLDYVYIRSRFCSNSIDGKRIPQKKTLFN